MAVNRETAKLSKQLFGCQEGGTRRCDAINLAQKQILFCIEIIVHTGTAAVNKQLDYCSSSWTLGQIHSLAMKNRDHLVIELHPTMQQLYQGARMPGERKPEASLARGLTFKDRSGAQGRRFDPSC